MRTPKCDSLATDLWGDMDGVTLNQYAFGKGMTYWGITLDEVLTRLKTPRDFASSGSLDNPPAWVHRHAPDAEIYFVANQADAPVHLDARFRVTGKDVQIWRPMDGEMTADKRVSNAPGTPLSHASTSAPEIASRAFSPLCMQRSLAIPLCRSTSPSASRYLSSSATLRLRLRALPLRRVETKLATLSGPWTLNFPPNWGAPASMQMRQLASWTDSSDPGVKYFSGTATYSKTVQAPASWFRPGQHIWIDLDKVRDIAEVKVNGKSAGLDVGPSIPRRCNRRAETGRKSAGDRGDQRVDQPADWRPSAASGEAGTDSSRRSRSSWFCRGRGAARRCRHRRWSCSRNFRWSHSTRCWRWRRRWGRIWLWPTDATGVGLAGRRHLRRNAKPVMPWQTAVFFRWVRAFSQYLWCRKARAM